MTKVKLSEVIRRCQTRADRYDTNLLYYVAGEHFESGEIDLAGRGEIAGSTIGPMFYYAFKPGDFLLVSRNPHLRKASRVDFAGVCSEKTFVLETADESVLSNEYLPWVLQNDRFWNYAQENRHGSTNFFINWSTLADYVFELPSIEDQKQIATILWAAQSVRRNYRKLLKACDDVVKSQFVEIFSEKEFPLIPLSQACTKITDGTHKTPQYQEAGIAFISAKNVTSDGKLDFSDIKHISTDEYESIQKRCETQIGDVLLTKSGSLGMPAIVDVDFPIGLFESLAVLKYRRDILDGVFLREQLKSARVQDQFTGGVKGIAVKHLHLNVIGRTSIIVPPLELQEEFTDFVLQVDKSKFKLGTCGGML
ncbi:restriction endonuclease subunit S [Collinsella aerofaciens]|uniref:restriction endonuclease subunit S n=1 Tax=Collinsella aerofaciens TaxID=74426 RepID=UPI00232F2EBF|nr:restriction endonuclease subunit S [Collinsella aerofaciens]MDB1820474.1 restriction endonuclease subunit S [Collinsella aerofaciens]